MALFPDPTRVIESMWARYLSDRCIESEHDFSSRYSFNTRSSIATVFIRVFLFSRILPVCSNMLTRIIISMVMMPRRSSLQGHWLSSSEGSQSPSPCRPADTRWAPPGVASAALATVAPSWAGARKGLVLARTGCAASHAECGVGAYLVHFWKG